MQVSQKKLTDLLVGMGVVTASGWELPKLQVKVNNAEGGISKFADPNAPYQSDAAQLALYDQLAAAQAAGEQIEVVADGGEEPKVAAKKKKPAAAAAAPAKKKPGSAGGRKAAAPAAPAVKKVNKNMPPEGASYQEQMAWYKKHPQDVTDKGPGVMRTVVRELKAAGKGAKPKPVSKAHVLGVLKEEFPDRDPIKMLCNLHNIIPGRLRRIYGLHVWAQKLASGETGYYLPGDGRTPQPKEPKPKPEAKKPATAKKRKLAHA